ncbi:hypothetical protein FB451DRAFT_1024877 [Mycena latifolia]|nr:hypothetical protein FB451DRAFT_1024877 [Mycena latifolia]
MAPGFLLVTSEPGPDVSLDEFQDWYNNEHVPLRLNHLTSFLTGARFRAADSLAPTWLAVYDIDDTATFAHESYTRLRANRSPREASLVNRLSLLDRRTYVLLGDSGEAPEKTSSYAAGGEGKESPTPVLLTQWLDDAPEEAAAGTWRGVRGWVRTRTYECIDNLRSGTSVPPGPQAQKVPRYLVVHGASPRSADARTELLDLAAADAPTFAGAGGAERRLWALYRAYPGVAQGNVEVAA